MTDEKKVVNETTNKNSNSLMRKTKVQLVDIILRKDSVEQELRQTIKIQQNDLNDKYNKLESIKEDNKVYIDKIKELKDRIDVMTNKSEEFHDEYASIIENLRDKYNKANGLNIKLLIILLIITIIFITNVVSIYIL